MSLEERIQLATAAYQKLQNELSVCVEARQRLDTQLTETGVVKKVRHILDEAHESAIHRTIGV